MQTEDTDEAGDKVLPGIIISYHGSSSDHYHSSHHQILFNHTPPSFIEVVCVIKGGAK